MASTCVHPRHVRTRINAFAVDGGQVPRLPCSSPARTQPSTFRDVSLRDLHAATTYSSRTTRFPTIDSAGRPRHWTRPPPTGQGSDLNFSGLTRPQRSETDQVAKSLTWVITRRCRSRARLQSIVHPTGVGTPSPDEHAQGADPDANGAFNGAGVRNQERHDCVNGTATRSGHKCPGR